MMSFEAMQEFIVTPVPMAANGYDKRWGRYTVMNTALVRALVERPNVYRPLIWAKTR